MAAEAATGSLIRPKGGSPATISKSIAASDQMSEANVSGTPSRNLSGAAYVGVPTNSFVGEVTVLSDSRKS